VPKQIAGPIVAAVAMNAVMVLAHVPGFFDTAMEHDAIMQWVMEPAFLFSGMWFFHYLLPSWPRRVTIKIRLQLAMVLASMLEMLIMAMSMSIFTKTSWYSVYGMSSMPSMPYMPGMGLSPAVAFHQQQLAAAILWICGDFWAVPCLVLIVRRIIVRDGSLLAALDRQSSTVSSAV
jgi:cytochrome c oxidase assembly factor CtaG